MVFCTNCGSKNDDGVKFCSSCGKAINGVSNGLDIQKNGNVVKDISKVQFFRFIILGCAIVLCLLFFTLPILRPYPGGNLLVTSLQLASGSVRGVFSTPLIFLALIFPVILGVLAFLKKSFAILRNFSIIYLIAQGIYLLVADSIIRSSNYTGQLLGNNWIIIILIAIVVIISAYCTYVFKDDMN